MLSRNKLVAFPIAVGIEVAVIAALLWLWWPFDIFSNEITSYPAICANDVKVLPYESTQAFYRNPIGARERMQKAAQDCNIMPLKFTTYTVNSSLGEVYYESLGSIRKLVNCAIISRSDWTCEYPDHKTGVYDSKPYSGKVVFIDGRQALHAREVGQQKPHFFLRRWQWWSAKSLSAFVDPVRSSLLIPEQQEHY